MKIIEHPTLEQYKDEWQRFRHAYEGGRRFVDHYLKKYDVRESDTDFEERRDITYCPGFAGAAVDEITNAIFSRLPDVVRETGIETYNKAINGQLSGIDYVGSTIDSFIGMELLPELGVMGRVGVYVDMPVDNPGVGRDLTRHPYFYIYRAEDIINWTFGEPGSGHEFTRLLLRDNYYRNDPVTGFYFNHGERYRLLEVVDGKVQVTLQGQDVEGNSFEGEPIQLDVPKIPFVFLQLKHSLLKNVADYQVALLNMESTDVDFARKINFPIYVEQNNLLSSLPNNKPDDQYEQDGEPDSGTAVRQVGSKHGIRYAKGLDAPQFINPSSESLKIAMEKEDQMKKDIRLLVHLNVASMGSATISRESKDFDREGLENGLAHIALVLEEGERKLVEYWGNYESKTDDSKISYPRSFDLRTDDDRRKEAKDQIELAEKVQSDTFKREVIKHAVDTLMKGKVSESTLNKMKSEIDKAATTTSDPKTILEDLNAGLVTAETASMARGYKREEATKAQKEREERMAHIAAAQGGQVGDARGVSEGQMDQPDSSDEKEGKQGRGEQKLNKENPDG